MNLENIKGKDVTWVKTKITEWMERNIFNCSSLDEEIIFAKDLNICSRVTLAEEWYEHETDGYPYSKRRIWNVINEFYNGSFYDFKYGVAKYIDLRIVQTYVKKKEHIESAPSQIKININESGEAPYGLKFWYDENYEKFLPNDIARATDNQLRYLSALAKKNGYKFYYRDVGISKKEASIFIDYFLKEDFQNRIEGFERFFK